jgi:hypothetical protein
LSHCGKSWKCGNRELHLLSTLEYEVALILDWLDFVITFFEQFALLPLEETTEIAKSLGIRPAGVGRTIVMSSDFRIKTFDGWEVWSVKPEELITPRVLEKFEIERIYWKRRNSTCRLITNKQLPRALIASIRQIHKCHSLNKYPFASSEVVSHAEALFRDLLESGRTMVDASAAVDSRLSLGSGSGLVILKHLIARKRIPLDPLHTLNFDEPLSTLCN